jgi:rare lipoprotein A
MSLMCVRIFPAAVFAALIVAMAPLVQAQEATAPVANLQANSSSASGEVISGGKVTYYGQWHAGRKTANGERFDPNALTMAHRTLPFGTLVRVTNLHNNQSVVVRVNDRGPVSRKRVGDLTTAAASKINMLRAGVADVLLEIVNDILPGKDEKH